jgi:hypothetical protein
MPGLGRLGVRLPAMNGAVRMLWRCVERVELQVRAAGVDDLVPTPAGMMTAQSSSSSFKES